MINRRLNLRVRSYRTICKTNKRIIKLGNIGIKARTILRNCQVAFKRVSILVQDPTILDIEASSEIIKPKAGPRRLMLSEIIKVNTFLKGMDQASTSLGMARHMKENGSKIRSTVSA